MQEHFLLFGLAAVIPLKRGKLLEEDMDCG
jgi:hypothetical protein